MTDHRIIRIERTADGKGAAMWRMTTSANEKINLFAKQSGLLSDYPEVQRMTEGTILHWRTFPIRVETEKNGQWENVADVLPKPFGAEPDRPLVPDHALSRAAAVRWARFVLKAQVNAVTFDTETTGVDPAMDEVISVGVVDCAGEVIFDALIQPVNMANMTATNAVEVNGITPEMVTDEPFFVDYYSMIRARMDGRFWLGYNTPFDVNMLNAACLRANCPPLLPAAVHDAMGYAAMFIGEWDADAGRYPYLKLVEAAERLGVVLDNAHSAAADARATWGIAKKISEGGAG